MSTIIYHNPKCSTLRNVLAMIRQSGEEPTIIEYIKNPPSIETLKELITAMGLKPRDIIREKENLYQELRLYDLSFSDDDLIKVMVENPILINRPIVRSAHAAKLCRPAERVLELLPSPLSDIHKS